MSGVEGSPFPFSGIPGEPVYFDDELLIWNKPPDLPTSGRSLDDDDCLQFHFIQARGSMVWAVHQLDADTSGLNVFVLNKRAVGRMQKRMRSPNGQKTYLALVDAEVPWTQHLVDAPIARVAGSMCVTDSGKPARTEFKVRRRGEGATLLEARLFSGRTHQIRVHLQHLGLSLFGEEWYRTTPCDKHPRQALHAWKLEFADGLEPSAWLAPPPDDLIRLCESIVWHEQEG